MWAEALMTVGGWFGYVAQSPGDTGVSGLYILLGFVIVGVYLVAAIGAKIAKMVVREGREMFHEEDEDQ